MTQDASPSAPHGSPQEMKGIGRLRIHDGQFEAFKAAAERCVEIVRAQDTGTLQYELFLSEDRTECLVFERYRDSEAGLEHARNIAEAGKAMAETAEISGEVFGDPSPELRAMLEEQGVKIYSRFLSA